MPFYSRNVLATAMMDWIFAQRYGGFVVISELCLLWLFTHQVCIVCRAKPLDTLQPPLQYTLPHKMRVQLPFASVTSRRSNSRIYAMPDVLFLLPTSPAISLSLYPQWWYSFFLACVFAAILCSPLCIPQNLLLHSQMFGCRVLHTIPTE